MGTEDNFDEQKFEEKFDLKIATEIEKAKREISEKRLQFYIKVFTGIGALFVIGLPFLLNWILASQNNRELEKLSDKIETQRTQLNDMFEKKSGEIDQKLNSGILNMNTEVRKGISDITKYQTRTPKFDVLYDNRPLKDQIVELSSQHLEFIIRIKNSSEVTARGIGLILYSSDSTLFNNIIYSETEQWGILPVVDEPLFKIAYKCYFMNSIDRSETLSPDGMLAITLRFGNEIAESTYNSMLKITHEQGSPTKTYFKIKFKK